jgi:hypothetical protein
VHRTVVSGATSDLDRLGADLAHAQQSGKQARRG